MHVGVCRVVLRIPGNSSLKGKRQIAQSVLSRLHSKFNVSAAEVEQNDSWQTLVLGISCVSNDGRHANSVMSNVVNFITETRPDLELIDYEVELVSGV